jgi:hypothetical protein
MFLNWKRWSILVCSGAAAVFACSALYVIGGLLVTQDIYRRIYLNDRKCVEAKIKGKPAFSILQLRPLSDGGVWLDGEVATEEDRQELRRCVVQAIGEPRAEKAIAGIKVRSPR